MARRAVARHWCRVGTVAVHTLLASLMLGDGARAEPLSGATNTDACQESQTIVESAEGEVHVGVRAASYGMSVPAGDEVRVGPASRATLRMLKGSTALRLDENTTLRTACAEEDQRSVIELIKGALSALARFPHKLIIRAPFANAAIEGTEFVVATGPDYTDISVYEGRVRFFNSFGEVVAVGGHGARARPSEKPRLRLQITPRDRVQWTLFLPTPPGSETANEEIFAARDLLTRGRLDAARERLAAQRNAADLRARAVALATEALIGIADNAPDAALRSATTARDLLPEEPYVRIALSYALQANDRLDAALDELLALPAEARSAGVYARISELELGRGARRAGLAAARQAVALTNAAPAPLQAWARATLGYALLARFKLADAVSEFRAAVELAPDDPRARFGLGLALIRERDMDAGRIQIELATLLDPTNALYRNYLGRLYHEQSQRAANGFRLSELSERLDGMALDQFQLAEGLDENDPTTPQNRVAQLRDDNRPLAAITPAREAVARNNRRAVYRSRTVLERDLASRAVSLASLYQRAGFRELATIEASRAVELDPTNDAAHEILSRINAQQFHSDVTAASEALQAQLYQPITRRPISITQRELGLRTLRATDLSEWSLGEYSSAFETDGVSLDSTAMFGTRGTLGNENQLVGLYGPVMLNVGSFLHRDNGFRANSHSDSDIYSALVQARVLPGLNVQSEFRRRETDLGDLLTADSKFIDSSANFGKARETARIGFHYDDLPGLNLVGTASFVHLDEVNRGTSLNGIRASKAESRARDLQFAGVFDLGRARLWAGGRRERSNVRNWDWLPGCPGTPPPEESFQHLNDFSIIDTSGFAYVSGALTQRLRVVTGIEIEDRAVTDTGGHCTLGYAYKHTLRVLPKVGFEFQADSQTRFRVAYFEGRDRLLSGLAALSPTGIVGFNQLYDEVAYTYSKNIAAAMDGRLGEQLYAGASVRQRRLSVPVFGINPYYSLSTQWEISGYLHQLFFDRFGVALQPSLLDDEYVGITIPTPDKSSGAGRKRTFIAPASVRAFGIPNPFGATSGWMERGYVEIEFSYVTQTIQEPFDPFATRDTEQFFTVDATLGFVMRGRRGMVALQARNLTGERFTYREPSIQNAEVSYARFVPVRSIQAVVSWHWDQ